MEPNLGNSNLEVLDCIRCKGDACFKFTDEEGRFTMKCMGCGFMTSSEMKGDNAINLIYGKNTPQIYLDLIFKDEDGYFWIPDYINLPKQGMVFVEGKSKEDWEWASIKYVKIKEYEKHRFPEGTEYKTDPSTLKRYGNKGYMDALDGIGGFEKQ